MCSSNLSGRLKNTLPPPLFPKPQLKIRGWMSKNPVRQPWVNREYIASFFPGSISFASPQINSSFLKFKSSQFLYNACFGNFCYYCSNTIAISGGNLNIMRILNLFMHFHLLRTLTLIQKTAPGSTVPYMSTQNTHPHTHLYLKPGQTTRLPRTSEKCKCNQGICLSMDPCDHTQVTNLWSWLCLKHLPAVSVLCCVTSHIPPIVCFNFPSNSR